MGYFCKRVLSVAILIMTFAMSSLTFAENDLTTSNNPRSDEFKNSCEQYSKAEVSENVKLLIQNLFSSNKPTVADVLHFIGNEAASEGLLEIEYELNVTRCLKKWKATDWNLLSESQKSSCGDFTNETNESLFLKKLRLKTGLIKTYSINEVRLLKSDNNWNYYKVLVIFIKSGNTKKSSLEIAHRSDKCIDDGGWMQIIAVDGKSPK